MADIPTIIVSAVAGGAFTYCTTYFIERFKRSSIMTDARRKAYASWFTAEALMLRRVHAVSEKLVGFPTDPKRHEALIIEITALVDDGRALITAMNEAFLTESSRNTRKILSSLHEFLITIVSSLEFAGRHYTENLEFHETFSMRLSDIHELEAKVEELSADELEQLSADELRSRLDRVKERWRENKAMFEAHDAECPFKSSKFRDDLRSHAALIHEQVERLRDVLAGTLSR
jgi:hypothetical protein